MRPIFRFAGRIGPWGAFVFGWGIAFAQPAEPGGTPLNEIHPTYDVVVAGAGTGGIGAAIQAARLGASVLLIEETDWVGGQMLAAAVSAIDEGGAGNLVRTRGLYRELIERVDAYYQPLGWDPFAVGRYTNTRFEPRVGRRLVHDMLRECAPQLSLLFRARITRVHRIGNIVTGIEIEVVTPSGRETRSIASKVLIDATEWGDVLPLAGVRYRSGNRTSEALDATRLIQENTWTAVVKRYPKGAPANLRVTTPPPGYAQRQPVFAKAIVPGDAPQARGQPMSWLAFIEYRGMPNTERGAKPGDGVTRTHLNFSNDYPCRAGYLEDPAERRSTGRQMRLRTLQLLYYIQHDMGHADWTVATDEGFDSAFNREEIDAWIRDEPQMAAYRDVLYQFSTIPYVRESRRLVGLHTLTAREISRGPGRHPFQFPTTVCLGDYRLDLHGGRGAEHLELDLDRLEDLEDAQPGRAGPFAIPAECLVPETVDGFLGAEKNFSQTRLVNGATRMQPHTMNLGQAAGALAALAVRHGVPPRRIDPVLVQRVLLAAGSTLAITPVKDVPQRAADWAAVQLVVVRGLLSLEDGRFFPQRPLKAGELDAALSVVAGGKMRLPTRELTRAEFARVLGGLGNPAVKFEFVAGGNEPDLPITRSEAAQVLAEYLDCRATGQLTGRPQTLAWNRVRAASSGEMDDGRAATPRYVQHLVTAGVLTDAAYWAQHAVEGQMCDGERVAQLLRRAAKIIDPSSAGRAPIHVLAGARIIGAPDYWAKNAVAGGQCLGRNVAALIRNLAAHPAMRGGGTVSPPR